MNRKEIRKYIEMRLRELTLCLENPAVYHTAMCEARISELSNLLKAMGE